MIEKQYIERHVQLVLCKRLARADRYYVPVGISARHLHLCREDIDILFGKGATLTEFKSLVQPEQYAAEQKITLKTSKGEIGNIRVLGPERKDTQVELSVSDCYRLGIKPTLRMSGNIMKTPGAVLIGPKGSVTLQTGIIVAARHLHISSEQAELYSLKNGDTISIKKKGDRGAIFNNVIVRSGDAHALELHLDIDEANAAMITNGELLEIVR